MAKRGGFPGGAMPGNMSNLMKQAQRMQRQMEESQKELETREFTAKTGGGAVEVTVSGKKELVFSNCCNTLEEAAEIARKLQARIYEKCQLTASAGVSYNKFLAKCASDFRKPAGLTLITPETVQDFLDPFPVEKFHGIGKVSAKKLRSINIKCGSDLRKLPLETLKNIFGKAGVFYYGIVRGVDDRPVETEYDPKSISREVTLYEDCTDVRKLRILLKTLARRVARRAENSGFVGQSVSIKLKYDDFQTVTRSVLLDAPCVTGTDIGNAAVQLLQKTEAGKRPVRLIGVGVSHRYIPTETEQLNLPFNK